MSRSTARHAASTAKAAASAEKSTKATRGRVVPDLSLWQSFQRIGGGLTPAQVSNIIREADSGNMRRLMDLGNEARQKDCHLQSVLATSEESIAGLNWELELPEKATKKETKAAKKIEAALRDVGLARLFAHHAGARFIGYAVTEPIYKRAAGLLVPDRFEYLAPRRFGFRPSDGTFIWRDDGMPFDGVDFRAEYPNKFVVSQPRVTGDVPCREGLIRVLMWAALFRNWAMSDWLKLGEIAWKPWRLGKYKKGTSQEDIDNLTAILEGLTSNGVATHSEDVDVLIQWASGAGGGPGKSLHSELVSTMAAEMSKTVLGQTLSTEQGSVGSQALGNVQNEQKKDLREATARYVANDVTRDLVVPMFGMNFGVGIRPSRLRLLTDDAQDLVAFSTGVEKLVGAGLRIPAEWARDKAGIPEPEEGEELIGGTVAQATPKKPTPPDDTTPDGAPADEAPIVDPNADDNADAEPATSAAA